MTDASDRKRDFCVSYTSADELWAEWVAWAVEEASWSVWFRKWDFRGNFVLQMDRSNDLSDRTIGILSARALDSKHVQAEWDARRAVDPRNERESLILIKVGPCEVPGLLRPFIWLDLTEADQDTANARLIDCLRRQRRKPGKAPPFPSAGPSREKPAQQPRFPAAERTGGRTAAAEQVPSQTYRLDSNVDREKSIDAIRKRVLELLKRHRIDPPTMAEILEVPLSILEGPELLDRLNNPTLERLAKLFCVNREWLVGEHERPMQHERPWYKNAVWLIRHLIELENEGLQPEIHFLKPIQMNADKAMEEEGARHRVGISVARTQETPSGRTFTTFEPWRWESWYYENSRIDFLSIVMIFDRLITHKLADDMKDAGMEDDHFWEKFRRINWHAVSDDAAISEYENCKLLLNELIASSPALGSAWDPHKFTDRTSAASKVKPEIEHIEQRYFSILKALAFDVRRSRWDHEDRR